MASKKTNSKLKEKKYNLKLKKKTNFGNYFYCIQKKKIFQKKKGEILYLMS